MNNTQALFAALEAGDKSALQTLLTTSPALAAVHNESGTSALLYALYMGKRELVPVLLEANQPLDIFEAAALGRTDRINELLLADKSLARAYTDDGFTALHFAAFFSGEAVGGGLLLDQGAEVEAVSQNPMKVTPLHSAIAGRNYALARLLVERGAPVNTRQEGGFTALHGVAQNGDIEMAELLIKNGADASLITDDGRTAAAIALASGHTELAQRLSAQASIKSE